MPERNVVISSYSCSVIAIGISLMLSGCKTTELKRPTREIEYHEAVAEPQAPQEVNAFAVTAAEATFGGTPTASEALEVLENEGYVIGYSETRKNALWAAYRLFPVLNPVRHDRPSWHIDQRTTAKVKDDCYTNSGFDRGHEAPNSAIDTRYGEDAQYETFQLSNASPQTCALNREPWQGLEYVIENEYATGYPEVYVINGPIFDSSPEEISCEIQVPVAFYKIVVEPNSTEKPRVLAVIMAQEDTGWHRTLSEFTTTVDCIEELTGLDFFPAMADADESAIESSGPDQYWKLDTELKPTHYGCPGDTVTAATIAAGNARRAQIMAACQ